MKVKKRLLSFLEAIAGKRGLVVCMYVPIINKRKLYSPQYTKYIERTNDDKNVNIELN